MLVLDQHSSTYLKEIYIAPKDSCELGGYVVHDGLGQWLEVISIFLFNSGRIEGCCVEEGN